MSYPSHRDLDWLVTDFTARVADVAHAAVVSADGVPLVTAEYNNGIPGVFIVAVFVDAVWRSKR